MRRALLLTLVLLGLICLPSIHGSPSGIYKEVSGHSEYGILISESNVKIPEITLVMNNASLDYGILITGSNVTIGEIKILGSGFASYAVGIKNAGRISIENVILDGPKVSYLFYLYQFWGNVSIRGTSSSFASTAFNVYYNSPKLLDKLSIEIYNSSFSKGSILDVYYQGTAPARIYRIFLTFHQVSFKTSGRDEPIFITSDVPAKICLNKVKLSSQAPSIEFLMSYWCKLLLNDSHIYSKEVGIDVESSSFIFIYIFPPSTISAPTYIKASKYSVVSCYTSNPAEISKRSSPYVSFYLLSGEKYIPWAPKIRQMANLSSVPEAAAILATILVVNVIGMALTRIGKKY